MMILPEEVTLTGWDTQRFEVRDGAKAVPATWKIEPQQRGTITSDGIYTAPRLVWVQRTVMVIATTEPANEVVLARVTLSNSRTWVTGLFSFLGLVATALMVALLFAWPKEPATSRALAIGPSSVVLEKGETQIFVASDPVDWSAEAPKGVFTAEADAGAVQVVGTKTEGKDKAATAAIKIGPTSLTVAPPLPVLHSGESIQLHAQTKATGATWTGSICTKQGLCTAPGKLAEERIVIATVSTQKPDLAASIPIRLLPDAPSTARPRSSRRSSTPSSVPNRMRKPTS